MATDTSKDLKQATEDIINAMNEVFPGRSKQELLEIFILYTVKREVGSKNHVATFKSALLKAATQYDDIGKQTVNRFKNFQTPIF